MSGVFVVIGANGGTGRQIVHALCRLDVAACREVRALVRDPSKVPAGALPEDDERVKLRAGDGTDTISLSAHLKGAEGVFFAAAGRGYYNSHAVDRDAVGVVARVSCECGVRRVLLLSSQLVHPDNRWSPIRAILNTINTGLFAWQGMMDFKYEGENLLRASGQEYTIVRPGRLVDGPLGRARICVGQNNASFMSGASSTRADVAACCVAAMSTQAHGAVNTTFEMACEPPVEEGAAAPSPPEATLFEPLASRYGEPPPAAGA